MFICLYGPDDYRRIQKKKALIAEFQKKHSAFGLGQFDLEDAAAAGQFVEFARNQSIFASAKLAILENAFEIEASELAKLLSPFVADRSTTVLIAEREKPVKKLSFLLEKPSLSQHFEALAGPAWGAFLKAEAEKLGLVLAPAAAQFLAAVHEGNSWALITELQKLAGFKRSISEKDLAAVDLELAPNYWALLNGLKSFDARARLSALERLFALNDPAPKIFNIVAAQAGEKTPRMAEYDLAVKSGKLDYEEVLLDLAIS